MKKIKIILVLMCLSFAGKAQVFQAMPQYGYGPIKRMWVDSTLLIPTICGTPSLKTYETKHSAIAYDSCNKRLYFYDPKLMAWDTIKSGSFDTTSLSNRIDSRVKYTDTAAMLTNYVRTSALAGKVNVSDTGAMLSPYMKRSDSATYQTKYRSDTSRTNTYNAINTKLNSADSTIYQTKFRTDSMRTNIYATLNGKVDSVKKSADSVYYYKAGQKYLAFRDSAGGGGQNGRFGNDTANIVMAKVHNDAGVQLTNGKVVYLSSSGTSSDVPSVRLANNKGDSSSANTFGFVTGTIAVNDTGWIILSGKIEKLNTSALSNGDIIYLDSVNGQWTKNKPSAPYHMVYLGVVVKANSGNGSIFVKCQNGYELDEIHDVQINNKVNNQVLVYSDTQKVWKNRSVYSVVDTTQLSIRIDQRVKYSDSSNIYQTKYRTDTMRTNLYNSLNSKQGTLTLTTTGSSGAATLTGNTLNIPQYSGGGGGGVNGSGSANKIAYWTNGNTISDLSTSTYPNLTELSYVKGTTSAIQTQINNKLNTSDSTTYQTKYRSDTARTNTYNSINTKLNISDTATMLSAYHRKADSVTYQTKYRTDTMRTNVYSALNGKQGTLTLTTSGSSGAATLTGNTLNIPQYSGGGGAASAGSQGNIQYKSGSGFGASSNLHWDTTNARIGIGTNTPVGKTTINLNNDNYTNLDGAGSHILMINPNATGQNVVSSYINGNLVAKWRTDYVGNVNWIANGGGHYFYTGGDFLSGSSKLDINDDGQSKFYNTLTTTGQRLAFRFIDGSDDILETDHFILAGSGDGNITLTLPNGITGQTYIFKKFNDENSVFIVPQSGSTIDGNSNYELNVQYQYIQIIADDGGSWWIIGNN